MTPDRRPFTNALIEALKQGTNRPVGDHKSPPETPNLDAPIDQLDEAFPYCIVLAAPGSELWAPPLQGDLSDANLVYQVRSVGLRRDQCEWMADTVRRTILSRTAAGGWQVPLVCPTGWAVNGRLPGEGGTGVVDEGTPPYQLFNCTEIYVVQVTPA